MKQGSSGEDIGKVTDRRLLTGNYLTFTSTFFSDQKTRAMSEPKAYNFHDKNLGCNSYNYIFFLTKMLIYSLIFLMRRSQV